MKLSAPVYQLKRQAKSISREEGIALHKALDRVALAEGFRNWSLLAAHLSANSPSKALLDRLRPGDLVLLGARPGQGKTMLSLELIVEAMKTMNQIPSPRAGKVVQILVSDGQPVEFDEPLVIVE